MIDPSKITKYDRTTPELEEVLVFWICVAGKTATVVSRQLETMLSDCETIQGHRRIFDLMRSVPRYSLPIFLKGYGIGCYNAKAEAIYALVHSKLDLHTCTLDDLLSIKGIGRKTARCFLIHSRRGCEHAGLDTHVLKFLGDLGHKVPKSTPASEREYKRLEKIFVELAQFLGYEIAALDLLVWNTYSGKMEFSKKDLVELVKMNLKPPEPPPGFRIVTLAEKNEIRGLSGYLAVYPKILHCISRYDQEFGWGEAGPYRYLWDDSYHAVPK